MEPELHPPPEQTQPSAPHPAADAARRLNHTLREGHELHGVEWALLGEHGLRVGWAVLLFAALYYVFRLVVGTVFYSAGLIGDSPDESAGAVVLSEMVPLIALAAAAGFMALFESRHVLSYNLAGPRRMGRFFSGFAAGFAALSVLVGLLDWGGWLHLAGAAMGGMQTIRFAVLWGCAFLLVGLVEEGLFRCYPLFTLARGINFWWALAAQAAACSWLVLNGGGNGAPGVYLAAGIGLVPCFVLHQRSAARSAFWQSAWVTSTIFGLYHTANYGENWIGIFAAASIGFVFCVSVYVTGSAWWAIGCHAAWDWAETFFYGTANSGVQGQGHLFAASPAGNPLWSGGADGPEGSLLVLGVILLLLVILLAMHGRNNSVPRQRSLTEETGL